MCLFDWGIEMIFTVITDNASLEDLASLDDLAIEYLRQFFTENVLRGKCLIH